MSMEYIKSRYPMVPAKRGAKLQYKDCDGVVRNGTVVGATAYLRVKFDGSTSARNIHPQDPGITWINAGSPPAPEES